MLEFHAGDGLERLGDVPGRDGAEKLALLAHADFDLHCLAVHFREHAIAGFLIDLLLAALLLAGLSLRDVDVVVGGRSGQLAGQEVVPGEAVGDVLTSPVWAVPSTSCKKTTLMTISFRLDGAMGRG